MHKQNMCLLIPDSVLRLHIFYAFFNQRLFKTTLPIFISELTNPGSKGEHIESRLLLLLVRDILYKFYTFSCDFKDVFMM